MTTAEVTQETKACTCDSDEEILVRTDRLLESFGGDWDELIPILQRAQAEFGYLPEPVMSRIATFLKLPESTVFGVATFYAQFKFVPTGRNVIRACRGTACHVRGAPQILNEIQKDLNIKPGETTPDLEYSLETVACFGSCALAPVVVVNDRVYGRMTPSKAKKIIGAKSGTS